MEMSITLDTPVVFKWKRLQLKLESKLLLFNDKFVFPNFCLVYAREDDFLDLETFGELRSITLRFPTNPLLFKSFWLLDLLRKVSGISFRCW